MYAHVSSVAPTRDTEFEFPRNASPEEQIHFFIRYAILAPSLHNSQPWAFAVEGSEARIFADSARWLRWADSDQRNLRISLGCALQNLVTAAAHFGHAARVEYYPVAENPMLAARVSIDFNERTGRLDGFRLFDAITTRRTNHGPYSLEPLSRHLLNNLDACCVEEGVFVRFTDDPVILRRFAELQCRADVDRFSNREYVKELEIWHQEGAYSVVWFLKKLHEVACIAKSGACPVRTLKDAPVLGMIGTTADDATSHLRAGRTFQRILLRAESLGLSVEPISYVLEEPLMRGEAARLVLSENVHAQIAFTLGYGLERPPTTRRRPLGDVIVKHPIGSLAVITGDRETGIKPST